ncbi:hypothetical protein N7512_000293 [Penicillium capsulatum]|nr:hypothetical protein N7512_000293 [Penicillium capsulatum]
MVRSFPTRSVRGRASRTRSQSTRPTPQEEQIPDVYQEMLEEAEARDPSQFSDRPVKRRRANDTKAIPVNSPEVEPKVEAKLTEKDEPPRVQTVYNSATEDESDVEWEDVDLQPPIEKQSHGIDFFEGRDETLQINLDQGPEPSKKPTRRRKPVTTAEKKVRLDVHKVHLLCLLAHVHLRNRWCNDDEVQQFLKKMLPKRIVALLNPSEDKDQFTRSTTFVEGLNQTGDIFNKRFRVNKPGIRRAHWVEDKDQLRKRMELIMSDAEVFLSKEDFRSQATTMQGSRDFGAQLFCALLRSVAVEARLVCSLQPLPFSGTVKDMTPSKPARQYITISSDDHDTSTNESKNPAKSPKPSRARRIGRPEFSPRPAQPAMRLAPANDPYNGMSYVVAFEDDCSARDVTRRYTKAFNAKTRKTRLESTRDGENWWHNALRIYDKPFPDDRDEIEISELTSKAAGEPMPRNIQDFKDHPIYALERHLNRNQVIFPKRTIGHVGLSKTTSKSDKLEPVYRRSDVHVVRSADKWYRLGRDVKVGEQPLKHVTASRPKTGFVSDEEETESGETALYAEYQTEIYVPPPVVQGRVPKNAYGNLDLYVPSMVPPGAVHVKRPDAARAARILGIDYADAVTGFDFKGRRGTAIFGGIVIALEYQEALEEVLKGMAEERQQAMVEARSAQALQFWRLFLLKLRIAERVKGYAGSDEENNAPSPSAMSIDEAEGLGGGFIPDLDQPAHSPPGEMENIKRPSGTGVDDSAAFSSLRAIDHEDGGFGGGFISEEPANSPAPSPAIPQPTQPPPPTNKKKGKSAKPPRYELVVVPSKPMPDEGPTIPQRDLHVQPDGSSEKVPIIVDSSTNGGSKSTSIDILSRPPSPQKPQPAETLQASDSEIEKGSLLSEDPEDEDAIPEWLM